MALHPYRDRYQVVRGMPEHGRPRADILREITDMATAEDAQGDAGRVSGSIYSGDHEHYAFLNDVFGHYSHANVIQRDMYPSATRFEGEIIAMTADLFHAPDPTGAVGVVTSGGTESLMNPLVAYREWGRERGIDRPNMVMPVTAHPALVKGAHYFGIEVRRAPVTDRMVVDIGAMRALVDDDTVTLIGSAGTYPHGVVDPIADLSVLALERGTNLHVDGCLGGFVLAWGAELGHAVPAFDLQLPGVTSISADTHKYGFALKGSSVLLYRSAEMRRRQYFVQTDWPGGVYSSPGMSGSRSGGIIAATWASMVSLGRAGYRAIAADIFATAARLVEIVRDVPELTVLGDPWFNVAFTTTADSGLDIFLVNDHLAARGWRMNGLQLPPALHFCITRPNTRPGVLDDFAADLVEAVEHARRHRGTPARSGAMYAGGVPSAAVREGVTGWLDAVHTVPQ